MISKLARECKKMQENAREKVSGGFSVILWLFCNVILLDIVK
jgi:hypothetical protein